ncbi:MAG TPA: hypothetical protein VNJ01_03030 [Bacteriovoracaceae bacterium]|nr:hypothetical protein [Bacteriovoracaceae bacterium]
MTTKEKSPIKIPIKDFSRKIICEGHLYLSTKEGRKFYLMKPGVLVDPAFIKKHAPLNTSFDFTPVFDPAVKESFVNLFRELKYLQFEKDMQKKCLEIVKHFQQVYSTPEHFLSFALACYQEFCTIPFEMQLKMHETDMHLFRKGIYSGAFAVITGMTNDFYHFLMIRDFYNLTFSLDMGLCDSNYSYYVAQGCNMENKFPGAGRAWLEQEHASELEISVFLKHPELTYQFLKKSDLLAYPELAEIALYQHELVGGNGFPRGLHKGQISSWEAVVLFADSLVEIIDEFTFDTSVIQYLLNFESEKLKELPVGKVYKKLCNSIQHLVDLEKTGT